jgi:hypothetical protein
MPILRYARCFTLLTPLLLAGCDTANSGAPIPTAPTSTTPPVAVAPLSLHGITMVPDGAGVQFNTDFQFTAAGSFPAGTQFVWNFGDGSSTTTSSPSVSRLYGQAGVFGVSVEARSSGAAALASKPVSVRSLVGRWIGTVTGFTRFPLQRPVPVTGFELLVVNQTLDGASLMLHGRWADNAGCRESRVEFLRQRLQPEPAASVTFGVNGLSCAEGDFYLTGLADAKFDRVDGHCDVAGGNPNCRFSMVRE